MRYLKKVIGRYYIFQKYFITGECIQVLLSLAGWKVRAEAYENQRAVLRDILRGGN